MQLRLYRKEDCVVPAFVPRSAPCTHFSTVRTSHNATRIANDEEMDLHNITSANISHETQSGQVRFEVPVYINDTVSLIGALEGVKERLGVEFYTTGKAELIEVFEIIVQGE